MISGIRNGNSDLAAVKSQYLEAQRNGDTAEMNKLKQQAMQIKNKGGNELTQKEDTVEISSRGMTAWENSQKVE